MHFFSKKCSISYILSSTNMYKKIVKTCHAKMLIPNQQLGGDDAKGLFGRAPALPKTAPVLAPQMERLFWWSWSRFRKYLAKQLHLLDLR